MKIDFANLQLQYQTYKKEIDTNIQNVLNKSNYILGEEVQILEQEVAKIYWCKICYHLLIRNRCIVTCTYGN
jgi:UDP-2-acetamido-2-deoxy-ribo-hexuluronate aminotransferase